MKLGSGHSAFHHKMYANLTGCRSFYKIRQAVGDGDGGDSDDGDIDGDDDRRKRPRNDDNAEKTKKTM